MRTLDNRHQQFEHLLNDCYRHPRSLTEAWPCTPTGLTVTKHYTPMTKRDKWFVVAVLCVFALWVALMLAGVVAS